MLFGVIIHAGILWASLALGYNSYKEYMSTFAPLLRTVKDAIKSTFPQAVIIFCLIYTISFISFCRTRTMAIFFGIWRYLFVFLVYLIALNIYFFSFGRTITITLNLSVLYLAILLPAFWSLGKYLIGDNKEDLMSLQEWLPPVFYRFLNNTLPRARSYIKEQTFAFSIAAFIGLVFISAFFLIFKTETVTGHLANAAYFLLIIGGLREGYLSIKN